MFAHVTRRSTPRRRKLVGRIGALLALATITSAVLPLVAAEAAVRTYAGMPALAAAGAGSAASLAALVLAARRRDSGRRPRPRWHRLARALEGR